MKLTAEQQAEILAEMAARKDGTGMYFFCFACKELHRWRGGFPECIKLEPVRGGK